MPLYEFHCPVHPAAKIERLTYGEIKMSSPLCACGALMELVEYSVPAKRNPDKGIQR